MSKFQFGDIVRHKESGAVFVLTDLDPEDNHVAALCKDDDVVYSVDADKLELIPHPDTARLDFLINKGGAAFFQDEVGDWQACAPSCLCEMADPEWSGFGSSPRQAIDAAIKLSE